ncbi:MAG: hypothetical protein IKI58_04175 [Oscillospiraceae bacterium]|nr:hypothetical protein [Oscillospiraceae bacterium]
MMKNFKFNNYQIPQIVLSLDSINGDHAKVRLNIRSDISVADSRDMIGIAFQIKIINTDSDDVVFQTMTVSTYSFDGDYNASTAEEEIPVEIIKESYERARNHTLEITKAANIGTPKIPSFEDFYS